MQIPPFLFHYGNMASGHMSEHTLLICGVVLATFLLSPVQRGEVLSGGGGGE